ncbi:MAG: 30S ribosomal protein S6 [Chloroflexota bacterium]|nr:30S ribosomal protein S6 [Chloroflexota bacterium]
MRSDAREPRFYELMTILSPEIAEDALDGFVDRITGFVTQFDGIVDETLRDSPWGRRRLAYPIRYDGRDIRDGYYTVFRAHITPSRVSEVERELKLLPELMRYLLTSYEPIQLDARQIIDAEVDADEAAAAAYASSQRPPPPALDDDDAAAAAYAESRAKTAEPSLAVVDTEIDGEAEAEVSDARPPSVEPPPAELELLPETSADAATTPAASDIGTSAWAEETDALSVESDTAVEPDTASAAGELDDPVESGSPDPEADFLSEPTAPSSNEKQNEIDVVADTKIAPKRDTPEEEK